jgi:hypothetical protein
VCVSYLKVAPSIFSLHNIKDFYGFNSKAVCNLAKGVFVAVMLKNSASQEYFSVICIRFHKYRDECYYYTKVSLTTVLKVSLSLAQCE